MRRKALFWIQDEAVDINLTPLIDVVFVVLITFIVVAPLLDKDTISLPRGRAKTHDVREVRQKSPVAIYVRQDDSIIAGGKQIDAANLTTYLLKAHATHPNIKPQLFHDKNAHFGTYQSVKNAVEEAGYDELEVVLEPR